MYIFHARRGGREEDTKNGERYIVYEQKTLLIPNELHIFFFLKKKLITMEVQGGWEEIIIANHPITRHIQQPTTTTQTTETLRKKESKETTATTRKGNN